MTPERHIRVSAMIGGTAAIVGIVLSISWLFIFDFTGWFFPVVVILTTMAVTTLLGRFIPKRLMIARCPDCENPMHPVEGSDPVAYQCVDCGHTEATTWPQWTPTKD